MQAQYDEIEVLGKTFESLYDIESRVDNIRRRISLLKQKIGYDTGSSEPLDLQVTASKAQIQAKEDTRDEMANMRAKMKPKLPINPIETETEVADRELREAIDKAMAKMK